MVWIFFLLVALLVVVATAAAITGRVSPDPMAAPVGSTPHHGLPDGRWEASDIDEVRFDTALRGYRMDQVDDVIDQLQQRIDELEAAAEESPERHDDGPGGD